MSLDDAIKNLWTNDFVQKNPRKSYHDYYPPEYEAVSAFVNGGADPGDISKFSRLGQGLVQVERERRGSTAPPSGIKLKWAPPTMDAPSTPTVTNGVGLPKATPGTGHDVVVKIDEPLIKPLDVYGYRNVIAIAGAFDFPTNVQNSRCIRVGACNGTVHLEGIDMAKSNTYFDAVVGVASGPGANTPGARVQIQNCRFYSGFQGNIGSGTHEDCLQNWDAPGDPAGWNGGARSYRFDHCTFTVGYQGIFMGNHAGGQTPQPIGNEDSYITNCNFKTAPNPRSNGAIYFWHSWKVDPWGYHTVVHFENTYIEHYIENVCLIPNKNGGGTSIAGADDPSRGYTVSSDHLDWLPTSDQQGRIDFGLPPDGDLCAEDAGMSYVPPGYL